MTDPSTTGDGRDDGDGTDPTGITHEIGENERPSDAVVRATASLRDIRVIDLEPLFDVVDPDHLDGLFDDRGSDRSLGERAVTFTFDGCRVSVTGDVVTVRPTGHTTD